MTYFFSDKSYNWKTKRRKMKKKYEWLVKWVILCSDYHLKRCWRWTWTSNFNALSLCRMRRNRNSGIFVCTYFIVVVVIISSVAICRVLCLDVSRLRYFDCYAGITKEKKEKKGIKKWTKTKYPTLSWAFFFLFDHIPVQRTDRRDCRWGAVKFTNTR